MKSIAEYMEDGFNVERYLSVTVCDENCIDVTDNDNYPGVDFLIYKKEWEEWDVKNAWHSENGGNKILRELRNINKWFRRNKNGSFNWHTFPYKSHLLSENGFRSFCNQEPIPTFGKEYGAGPMANCFG